MSEIKLVCPSCGQTFQAGANQKKAFCVNCGTMIDRSAELAEAVATGAAPAKTAEALAYEAALAAFAEVRFPVLDKKTGRKGDRLVGFWSMLIFHGHNDRSAWGMRTAKKEISQYFEAKEWQTALNLAGPQRANLIADQMLDSAVVFLSTCRDDSRYGSKLLGLMKMNADDIAIKSAEDVCRAIISFLIHIGRPGESDSAIYAAVMAYPRVFSGSRQILSDQMEKLLTVEERQIALSIVATIAERSRRQ
jgi:predicted RNA-binding Zn-ribbon protein involved in translation (DUF1610 family)